MCGGEAERRHGDNLLLSTTHLRGGRDQERRRKERMSLKGGMPIDRVVRNEVKGWTRNADEVYFGASALMAGEGLANVMRSLGARIVERPIKPPSTQQEAIFNLKI